MELNRSPRIYAAASGQAGSLALSGLRAVRCCPTEARAERRLDDSVVRTAGGPPAHTKLFDRGPHRVAERPGRPRAVGVVAILLR